MKFICLNSRSTGNGYILTNGKEAIVIEAGVRLAEAKMQLDFDVSIINALVVSHSHLDHSKFMLSYLDAGIDAYALRETFVARKCEGHNRMNPVESGKLYRAGNFTIMPFEVAHDVPCLGFMISHKHTGAILFVTDTFMLDYEFGNLSHIILECNYADDILQANIDKRRLSPIVRDRVFGSHIELETCKQILKSNDMSRVQNIILIHLSDGNSDADRFIREVSELTGKPTYVADKGTVVDLTKN